MRRVLCLVSNMNAGGAETFLMKLYRTIDRTKYQMDFCVNLEENYYAEEIKNLGGKIYYIPSRSESLSKHNTALAQIISEGDYKYVMAVSSSTTCYLDMKIAKDNGAERCIVRSSNASNGSGLKVKIVHKLMHYLYSRYVDVMISPSDLAAKFLFGDKAFKERKVRFLHNAINYDMFAYNIDARKNIREKFDCSDDDIIVGHVGRFNTQKNHTRLIDIFKLFNEVQPNSKLLLVGIGNLQESIKQKVEMLGLSEKVIFAGLQNNVPSLLSAMDVCLFPSFYEGMPNVIIEAQASGLSCVISDTITREANITGIVFYESLSSNDDIWVKTLQKALKLDRKDTRQDFQINGYLIDDVAKQFVDIVFN